MPLSNPPPSTSSISPHPVFTLPSLPFSQNLLLCFSSKSKSWEAGVGRAGSGSGGGDATAAWSISFISRHAEILLPSDGGKGPMKKENELLMKELKVEIENDT
jgi:hypothetical protein